MSIKSKLLQAIGEINIEDMGDETLVDILVDKIKSQERRIQELSRENSHERDKLSHEIEAIHQERKKMRDDPLYGAYGEFYFLGEGNRRFKLNVRGSEILQLCERIKKFDYIMQRIPGEYWNILEEQDSGYKRK